MGSESDTSYGSGLTKGREPEGRRRVKSNSLRIFWASSRFDELATESGDAAVRVPKEEVDSA